jgi:hypothetical protein
MREIPAGREHSFEGRGDRLDRTGFDVCLRKLQ